MLLFEEPVQKFESEIILNFFEFAKGFYLPDLFIVEKKYSGLGRIQSVATKKSLPGYNLELTEANKKLLNLAGKLTPQKLAIKFNPNPRKPQVLIKLLEDEKLKKSIEEFVHEITAELIRLATENTLSISLELPRERDTDDFLIEVSKEKLEPLVFFEKTETGVLYRLKMKTGVEVWEIQNKKVIPLTNHPAWILVENRLFKIEGFGGKMVLPFREKSEIQIPRKSVKRYFQKFILKQAANLDIEAKGFEIVENRNPEACELELTKDLFSKKLGVAMRFVYPEVSFLWNDPNRKKTELSFDESSEEVLIRRTVRDEEKERFFIEKLEEFGLDSGGENLFRLPDGRNGNFALPEWFRKNGAELYEAGFTLKNIQIGERKIIDAEPIILRKIEKNIDWFDVFIEIEIGSFRIPFSNLIENIRSGNRYYRLPGGMFFLIKEEWMSQFEFLVRFGKRAGEARRLSKNHYEVLQLLEPAPDEDGQRIVKFEVPDTLKASLRPYQIEGVEWLFSHYRGKTGACLADDMGLGKTLQTIAILLYAKAQKKKALNALIVLPASLVFNWESELKKFAPSLSVYRHTGSKRNKDYRLFERNDINLTTYQTALNDSDILTKVEFEFVVLDEGQYIKNNKSKVFKVINGLTSKHRISLSGTPIENSLSDLWSQMEFINPGHLGSVGFFKKEFIYPIEKLDDEGRKKQLRALVSPFLLRRKKEEVAKDLPDLEVQIFYSEMLPEQKQLYEREKSKARNALLDNFRESDFEYQSLVLRTLLKLRQLVNHPRLVFDDFKGQSGKFESIMAQFESIRKSKHKVLMFSSFTKYLDLFVAGFSQKNQPFSHLTGKTSAAARREEVEKFQINEDVRAFLISTKAGGTGLNLTAADYVFLMDPWWNPAAENQVIARAHRIGQTRKVIATKFITKDSVEEKILALQKRKSALAEDILAVNKKRIFSKDELGYLLD